MSFLLFYPNLENINYFTDSNIRYTAYYLNYNILNCIFTILTLINSNGGAISISQSNNINFLVENSLFYKCKIGSNFNGGAIYFNNMNNANCILYKICGYNCEGDTYSLGQMSFISSDKKNFIYFSSIINCSYFILHQKTQPIRILYGFQELKNTNFSNNINHATASFCSYQSIYLNSKYNNINKCYVNFHTIIFLYGGNNNSISFINLINNIQITRHYGIVTCGWTDNILTNLLFFNNILYNNSLDLFYSGPNCNFFIFNCYSDSYSTTYCLG